MKREFKMKVNMYSGKKRTMFIAHGLVNKDFTQL